jgi:hypothetical protein
MEEFHDKREIVACTGHLHDSLLNRISLLQWFPPPKAEPNDWVWIRSKEPTNQEIIFRYIVMDSYFCITSQRLSIVNTQDENLYDQSWPDFQCSMNRHILSVSFPFAFFVVTSQSQHNFPFPSTYLKKIWLVVHQLWCFSKEYLLHVVSSEITIKTCFVFYSCNSFFFLTWFSSSYSLHHHKSSIVSFLSCEFSCGGKTHAIRSFFSHKISQTDLWSNLAICSCLFFVVLCCSMSLLSLSYARSSCRRSSNEILFFFSWQHSIRILDSSHTIWTVNVSCSVSDPRV